MINSICNYMYTPTRFIMADRVQVPVYVCADLHCSNEWIHVYMDLFLDVHCTIFNTHVIYIACMCVCTFFICKCTEV